MGREQMSVEEAWKILLEVEERTIRIEEMLVALSRPSEPISEHFLTAQEAAKLLGIKVSTLYCKVSNREVPYYKHGKILQFDRNELVEWVQAARKKTLAERLEENESQRRPIRRARR